MFFTTFFIIKRPSKVLLKPWFVIVQLVLSVLYIVSCFFSTNTGFSIPNIFIWINCWLLVDLFLLSQTPIDIFINTIIKLAIIYSVVFIVLRIQPLNITFFTDGDAFINPYLPNVQICNFLVFAIPLVYFYRKIKYRLFLLLILSLALFAANSRTAIISTILGLEIINHFHPQPYFSKVRMFLLVFLVSYISFFLFGKQYTTDKSPDGSRQYYWHQAIKAIQEKPLFGVGPGNFLYASVKYQTPGVERNAMNAHDVFLSFLSENGIFFSLLFFSLIIYALRFHFFHNPIQFTVGLVSLFNASFGSSWNSPGILIISLIIILYNSNLTTIKNNHTSRVFLLIFAIPILVHFIRLAQFNQLVSSQKYIEAISLYPYDVKLQIKLIKEFQDQDHFLPFFRNDFRIYETASRYIPLSEKYFYHLLELEPQGSFPYLTPLIKKYLDSNDPKIEKLFSHFLEFVPITEKHQFSYYLNRYANINKSEFYYQKAIEISPGWAPLYIDYANYLWHSQQTEKAINVLGECQQQLAPRQECLLYLQANGFYSYPPGLYPIPPPDIYDDKTH